MMNAGNLPGISRIFRLLLYFTVIYSMLAWCSDIAASDNARRPYVPPSEVPAILQSTPEEVAQGWDWGAALATIPGSGRTAASAVR